MLGFTGFEVHETFVWDDSLFVRSVVIGSIPKFGSEILKHSLLEFVETIPEMLDVNVLKSPTRPEVAGEDVVLVGEFELLFVVATTETFSDDLLEDKVLSLESVGSGNSSK